MSADKPTSDCAAHGCPMLGSMSAGCGGGEFWCFAHFGRDPGQIQGVTAELHRLHWLAAACRDLRVIAHPTQKAARASVAQRIHQDLALAQRGDLRRKDHETGGAWMVRLETELQRLCLAAVAPQEQAPIDMETA